MRLKNSYSRRAGDCFIQEWKTLNPKGKIINRELGIHSIPHLDQSLFEEFHSTQNSSDRLKFSDMLIEELFESDEILITVPMYNFGIPSSLKAYFDLVIRTGKTFYYQEKAIGLLKNKKAYIISSMGDVKLNPLSLVELHIQAILNYIGVSDIFYYPLDGTSDARCVNQHFENLITSFNKTLNKK